MLRRLLRQYNIPTPSGILANIVALKLGTLNTASFCDYEFIHVSLPIGDRELEIRSWIRDGRLRDWDGQVGMPGAPRYKTVELEGEDRRLVGEALLSLWERIRQGKLVKAQAESEMNALDILEQMLHGETSERQSS